MINIMGICPYRSYGQYGHMVKWTIWSNGQYDHMIIWSNG